MHQNMKADPEQYGYASGRIRAMEVRLMDAARLNRLFEARTPEDISRIMQESGYAAGDPEVALVREEQEIYGLLGELMKDHGFAEALLLFHDCHNLKVILKYLAAWWPHHTGEAEAAERLPESDASHHVAGVEPMFQLPALVPPARLFQAVRDRQSSFEPAWLYQSAIQAVSRYRQTYDIGSMDAVIDQAAFAKAEELATGLQNRFFSDYLKLRQDMINLELMLRCKSLHLDEAYFAGVMLAGGTVESKRWHQLYRESPEAVADAFKSSPIRELAEMATEYGQPGSAARFGRMADRLLLQHIGKTRWILRGPEIPVAYILTREIEIKNIRIALTCLRNGIPSAQARDMMR